MRAALFVVVVCACGTAFAQEAPPPAPQPQPQQPAGLYRFTLTNGNVVDGYWVGGDAQNIHVQTQTGVFSLAVVNVRSYAPLAPVTYTPAPQPLPEREAVEQRDAVEVKPKEPSAVKMGLGVFIMSYSLTVLIAHARSGKDPDATKGYFPVIGPIAWASTDDDKFGSDGYDWLAMLSAFAQGGAIYGMIKGALDKSDEPKPKAKVSVTPVSRRDYGGISVMGTF